MAQTSIESGTKIDKYPGGFGYEFGRKIFLQISSQVSSIKYVSKSFRKTNIS